MSTFAMVLDEAADLSLDEQEQLAETLRRRIAEQRRAEILKTAGEARREFDAGKLKASSVTSLMKKIRA